MKIKPIKLFILTVIISTVFFLCVGTCFAADTPKAASSPKVTDTPKAASSPKAADPSSEADLPETDLPEADLPETDLPEATSLTIMLTGDLMCQYNQQHAAYNGKGSYDFTPTFKYVKKIFKNADFVVGNLETLVSTTLPLAKDMTCLDTRPYLNAPEEFLAALKKAGFDGLAMANNHNCDGGLTGITETLSAVEKYQFKHTGTFASDKDDRFFILEKNGIKVGILSYAGYFNKKDCYLDSKFQDMCLNNLTQAKAEKDIALLKEAGADYIIAYSHSGTEYQEIPSSKEERFAFILANAGADYIINSHPHVLQHNDVITAKDGRQVPVVYSMGNFTSQMIPRSTRETIILSLEITKDPEGQIGLSDQTYYPLYMMKSYKNKSYVLVPETADLSDSPYKAEAAKAFRHIKSLFNFN